MVRIASCQITPANDLEARMAQIKATLAQAQAMNANFICLPEGALTGYYAEENLARKNSLKVGDPTFEEWMHAVKEASPDVTVIVGFNERDGKNIFDSAAVIENGRLLGVQRKHYLYHDYFTPGTFFSSFSSKGISFGVVICLDTRYFEPARLLALQGANILFAPMCNRVCLDHPYTTRPPYYSHLVARSFENRCWLVTADWVWPNDGTSVCPGHSVIYDSNGQEVARSHEGAEHLLLFDIPHDRLLCEKGRRIYGSSVLTKELTTSMNQAT